MKSKAVKKSIEQMNSQLKELTEKLMSEHPNHCIHCGGTGGRVNNFDGSYWEPPEYEWVGCEHCIEQGLHPLDTRKSMSDDESLEWCEMMVEGEAIPPLLDGINNLENSLNDTYEYLQYIETEEDIAGYEQVRKEASYVSFYNK